MAKTLISLAVLLLVGCNDVTEIEGDLSIGTPTRTTISLHADSPGEWSTDSVTFSNVQGFAFNKEKKWGLYYALPEEAIALIKAHPETVDVLRNVTIETGPSNICVTIGVPYGENR